MHIIKNQRVKISDSFKKCNFACQALPAQKSNVDSIRQPAKA